MRKDIMSDSKDVNQIFSEVITDLRKTFGQLNDDDNYELCLMLKGWFNKNIYGKSEGESYE